MSWDWADFLDLAQGLYAKPKELGPEDASYRTAISRAYYAAFHLAMDFAVENECFVPTGSGDDHWAVRSHFLNSGERTRQRIGNRLTQLLGKRRLADYDRSMGSQVYKQAGSSLGLAQKVLCDLATLAGASN